MDIARYTVYQARKPPRSEYRLYPATDLFLDRASVGDLLLVFAGTGDELRIVVAERESDAEKRLLNAFFNRDEPLLSSFLYVDDRPAKAALPLAELLISAGPAVPDLSGHSLLTRSIELGTYPTTLEMAEAARALVTDEKASYLGPDEYLEESLEAETRLYFAIEGELARADLGRLVSGEPNVTAVLKWAASRLNARKSRRGASLQRHFESLLKREQIPFTPECETGSPPPADIMVPSCAAYRNPAFDAARLRVVSCKSTLKERWMEVVPEASRIGTKYLLTLDPSLTDSVISAMVRARVQPVVPAGIIRDSYAGRASLPNLRTVSDLITELRSAVGS